MISSLLSLLNRLTPARATKLDNLDAAISSRSTLTAADVWAAGTRTLTSLPSVIKSHQTGETSLTGTVAENVTISSVDTGKCVLLVHYTSSTYGVNLRLTSSTNLRLYSSINVSASWQVIEFY